METTTRITDAVAALNEIYETANGLVWNVEPWRQRHDGYAFDWERAAREVRDALADAGFYHLHLAYEHGEFNRLQAGCAFTDVSPICDELIEWLFEDADYWVEEES